MNITDILFGKERSMIKTFRMGVLGVIILAVVLITLLWTIQEQQQFREESEKIRQDYMKMEKEFVKSQTNSVIRYINAQYEKREKLLKEKIRDDVQRAIRIADNLYQKNKGKLTDDELKKIILEALRNLYKSNEYVFVVKMDGTELLYPIAPEYEGKNLLDLQDTRGNYVIRDEISIVEQKGEGFVRGYWKKPEGKEGKQYPKLTFVKAFPHFDWYIGKGLYIDEFQQEIKKDVLNWASRIRYGKEGYVFINTFDGQSLLKDGEVQSFDDDEALMKTAREKKVFRKELQAVKNSKGGFIKYQWRKLSSDTIADKISFVRSFDQWNWIIGCGIYLDDVERYVDAQYASLSMKIKKTIFRIVAIALVIILLSLLFINRLSKSIGYDYRKLKDFLSRSSTKDVYMETSELKYTEVREIAEETNSMVKSRNQAMEDLKVEKLYLEKLLESAPEGVVVTDKRGNVLRVNSRFLSIFKYEQSEVLGKHIDDLVAPPEFRNEASRYTSLVGEGKEFSKETIRQTKYNERVHVSILASPIRSDIGEEAFYVIYRDINDRKKAEKDLKLAMEKAKEADRLKTAFLSNMSHEIRTPLNAIIGFSELMCNTEIDEKERKEYGNLVNQNSQVLLNLINDIIDISKIESGQLRIRKNDTDLEKLLNNLYETYLQQLKQKGKEQIELKLHVGKPEYCVRTDKDRLFQIMNNLLANALKFTNEGMVKFGYELKEGNLEFFVQDTGIGISKADQQKIFHRFQQADVSSTRKYGGTGLGLSISQSLTSLLGGKMKVESEPYKGSRFSFTIPDEPCMDFRKDEAPPEESTDEVSQPQEEKQTPEEETIDGKSILIVEDEDSNYLYIQAILKPRKYKYLRAIHAKKAVEIATQNEDVGLVLMDIQLPDYSGYEATEEIKNSRPSLPVIALTAYAMGEEKEKSMKAGCDDYLSKPVDKNKLLKLISQYI